MVCLTSQYIVIHDKVFKKSTRPALWQLTKTMAFRNLNMFSPLNTNSAVKPELYLTNPEKEKKKNAKIGITENYNSIDMDLNSSAHCLPSIFCTTYYSSKYS